MAATTQQLLEAVNDLIARRLAGDAYVEYTEQNDRFRGESLESLMAIRQKLQAELAAEQGSCVRFVEY